MIRRILGAYAFFSATPSHDKTETEDCQQHQNISLDNETHPQLLAEFPFIDDLMKIARLR